jgi:hypothetical protein
MGIQGYLLVGIVSALSSVAALADECAVDSASAIALRWEGRAGGPSWSEHVRDDLPRLGTDLLAAAPSDAAEWCPNFDALDCAGRNQMWAYLMSAMSHFESGHRPEVTYTEAFPDSSGNNVVSRGLLQISIESGRGYRCPLATAQDLHDPLVNLSCGIRILNRWVPQDGVIAGRSAEGRWLGAARYWSIFRHPARIASMKAWLHAHPLCQRVADGPITQ